MGAVVAEVIHALVATHEVAGSQPRVYGHINRKPPLLTSPPGPRRCGSVVTERTADLPSGRTLLIYR